VVALEVEGALLKIRGSILGIGTDLAGSVRIPALCNGVFGFKPTVGRIPYAGETWDGRLGSPSQILSTTGPEAHSVRDMELFMKVIIDSEPWNLTESVIGVPWRRKLPPDRKLRLGLLLEDVKRPLHPPMFRTMKSAENVLIEAGHTILPIGDAVPSLWTAAYLASRYTQLDPRNTTLAYLEDAGEPIIEAFKTAFYPENEGWQPSLDALWDLNVQRSKITEAYHDITVQNKLDGFIMPPYQSTAQRHDKYGSAAYTRLANFLNVSNHYNLKL
jgi:amidase